MIQFKKSLLIFIFIVSSGISFCQNVLPLPVCNCCPTVYTCGGSTTQVVEVINPLTGKTWMDRNLGASQVATSSTDAAAYGDLFQYGRACDGHQIRTSPTTTTLATTIVSTTSDPWYGQFIIVDFATNPNDIWLTVTPSNSWNGINSINNPCPPCYRLPSAQELDEEMLSWISLNAAGAYNSNLKFTMGGRRQSAVGGDITLLGTTGNYWSSTSFGGVVSNAASFTNSSGTLASNFYMSLGHGASVRCIKN